MRIFLFERWMSYRIFIFTSRYILLSRNDIIIDIRKNIFGAILLFLRLRNYAVFVCGSQSNATGAGKGVDSDLLVMLHFMSHLANSLKFNGILILCRGSFIVRRFLKILTKYLLFGRSVQRLKAGSSLNQFTCLRNGPH
jgi:hypothetical protein